MLLWRNKSHRVRSYVYVHVHTSVYVSHHVNPSVANNRKTCELEPQSKIERGSFLAVFDLRTRRNQNQKILSLDWFWYVANQSVERIFWFWFLLVRKSNTALSSHCVLIVQGPKPVPRLGDQRLWRHSKLKLFFLE